MPNPNPKATEASSLRLRFRESGTKRSHDTNKPAQDNQRASRKRFLRVDSRKLWADPTRNNAKTVSERSNQANPNLNDKAPRSTFKVIGLLEDKQGLLNHDQQSFQPIFYCLLLTFEEVGQP